MSFSPPLSPFSISEKRLLSNGPEFRQNTELPARQNVDGKEAQKAAPTGIEQLQRYLPGHEDLVQAASKHVDISTVMQGRGLNIVYTISSKNNPAMKVQVSTNKPGWQGEIIQALQRMYDGNPDKVFNRDDLQKVGAMQVASLTKFIQKSMTGGKNATEEFMRIPDAQYLQMKQEVQRILNVSEDVSITLRSQKDYVEMKIASKKDGKLIGIFGTTGGSLDSGLVSPKIEELPSDVLLSHVVAATQCGDIVKGKNPSIKMVQSKNGTSSVELYYEHPTVGQWKVAEADFDASGRVLKVEKIPTPR